MQTRYLSDNGAPCWKCKGTCFGYTIDSAVSYVAAWCASCGADNMFYPPQRMVIDRASFASAAHRASYFGCSEVQS